MSCARSSPSTMRSMGTAAQPAADGPAARLDAMPAVKRVPARALPLFIVRNSLDAAICSALIARIDAQRRPSQISDDLGIADFRTSETCDLDSHDPLVGEVEHR